MARGVPRHRPGGARRHAPHADGTDQREARAMQRRAVAGDAGATSCETMMDAAARRRRRSSTTRAYFTGARERPRRRCPRSGSAASPTGSCPRPLSRRLARGAEPAIDGPAAARRFLDRARRRSCTRSARTGRSWPRQVPDRAAPPGTRTQTLLDMLGAASGVGRVPPALRRERGGPVQPLQPRRARRPRCSTRSRARGSTAAGRDAARRGSATPATAGPDDAVEAASSARQHRCAGRWSTTARCRRPTPVRAYTDDGRNYLRWLRRRRPDSLDDAAAAGGVHRRPAADGAALPAAAPRAAPRLVRTPACGCTSTADVSTRPCCTRCAREPAFVHVDDRAPAASESRWEPLYTADAAVTGDADTARRRRTSPSVLGTAPGDPRPRRADRGDRARWPTLPTARLERAARRAPGLLQPTGSTPGGSGLVHLPARADARPGRRAARRDGAACTSARTAGWRTSGREPRELTPVQLAEELDGGVRRRQAARRCMRDSANGGYIHAPSLNHAATAAVLRSGYLANATPDAPGALAVNLSSRAGAAGDGRAARACATARASARCSATGSSAGCTTATASPRSTCSSFALRKAFPLRADQLARRPHGAGRADRGDRGAQRRRRAAARRRTCRATGERTYPFGLPGLPARRRRPAGGHRRRGRRAARRPRRRRRPGARRGRAPGGARQLRPRRGDARRVRGRPASRPSPRWSRRRAAASR